MSCSTSSEPAAGVVSPAACPACRRSLDPAGAACPRCGVDLGPLRRVHRLAAHHQGLARRALLRREPALALAHARRAVACVDAATTRRTLAAALAACGQLELARSLLAGP